MGEVSYCAEDGVWTPQVYLEPIAKGTSLLTRYGSRIAFEQPICARAGEEKKHPSIRPPRNSIAEQKACGSPGARP